MENFRVFTSYASFGWITRHAEVRRYGSANGFWPIVQFSQVRAISDLLGGYDILCRQAASENGMRLVLQTICDLDQIHAKESSDLFL